MLRRIVLVTVGIVLVFSTPVLADWSPEDGHKMHFPQLPDEEGWDVAATGPQADPPLVLADDWRCGGSGPVTDIHFWGSWKHGYTGVIRYFVLSIHSDIPADPPMVPYSRPGETLWEENIYPGMWEEQLITTDLTEDWYNPATGELWPDDHSQYFQYNVFLPENLWFEQVEERIYWLNISAVVDDPVNTAWGWKSSINHWNDDAVYAQWYVLEWVDMWEPGSDPLQSLDLAFVINGPQAPEGACCYPDPTGAGMLCIVTDATDCGQNLMGEYQGDGTTCAGIQACCLPDGSCVMVDALCCANELSGTPMGVGSTCGTLEACCLTDGSCVMLDPLCCVVQQGTPQGPGAVCSAPVACCFADGSCTNLDPICCDDMGGSVSPFGAQACLGDGNQNGVDDACEVVVDEACCLEDGSCTDVDASTCISMGGTPQGPGTTCTTPEACCLDDGSCIMVDPLCCDEQGGTPQGFGTRCDAPQACCLSDGRCLMLDVLCCVDQGGVPQGAGSVCGEVIACCFDDGSCQAMDLLCCDDQGGWPSPIGATQCLGDANENTIDDACEEEVEACCLPGGACIETDPDDCIAQGGIPMGAGSQCTGEEACCLPNGECITVDPLCCEYYDGVSIPGAACGEIQACCLPNGTCLEIDALCCVEMEGTPQGVGTHCTAPVACCFDDNTCRDLDPLCCEDLGGFPSPWSAPNCMGDQNQNGIDDACEEVGDPEACCLPDGSCVMVTPTECQSLSGSPQGPGSQCSAPQACCLEDGTCANLDPLCCLALQGAPQGLDTYCTNPEACCMPDGRCRDLDPLCCELVGGSPSPIGAQSCLGDANQNEIDDACEEGTTIYYKPGYPDYAPYGMPDIDQKQANWNQFGPFTHCGPVAVANCLFWFDSKFQFLIDPSSPPPPAVHDDFQLIESDDPAVDDHDASNVVPVVDALADCMATGPGGTDPVAMYSCVVNWINSRGLEELLEVHLVERPDWEFIREEVKRSQDVILLLGFWQPDQSFPGGWSRIGGHFVTVAGLDTAAIAEAPRKMFVSDPFFDYQEILDGDPSHASEVHNDLALNSGPHYSIRHDEYFVSWPSESPGGVLWLPDYPIGTPGGWEMVGNFTGQNCPEEFRELQSEWLYDQIFVEVEYALNICPIDDENCCDIRGDFNHSGRVDVQDVVEWVDWSFGNGTPPVCEYPEDFWPECDMDGSDRVDVADIVFWVNWSFNQGDDPVPCP